MPSGSTIKAEIAFVVAFALASPFTIDVADVRESAPNAAASPESRPAVSDNIVIVSTCFLAAFVI
ncbi:MAG: hypothetical protein E7244_23770 [Enterocloster citroniae]|nr:hypothetical protein [Enterocloster citroniae]